MSIERKIYFTLQENAISHNALWIRQTEWKSKKEKNIEQKKKRKESIIEEICTEAKKGEKILLRWD